MESKIRKFKLSLDEVKIPWADSHTHLIIDRENILQESLEQVMNFDQDTIRSEFQIVFRGEIAQDAGGLMKEWINVLISELFSENRNLFVRTQTDELSYTIPTTNYDNLLIYYEFTGRMIAKALLENIPIQCHFSKVIFKHILKQTVEWSDLEYLDNEVYKSLMFMAENSIEGVFFETFSVEKKD